MFGLNCSVSATPRVAAVQIHRPDGFGKPYNAGSMSNPSQIDQIAERVERLLVRYQELQRTNALLNAQVDAVTRERDSLKSRLGAARSRVDALLERLPPGTTPKSTA